MLVFLSFFSDFSPVSSCSSKVCLKLKAMGSSETVIAYANAVGFVQFIKGIFLEALWRIHHGNVRLLVLVLCMQDQVEGLCEGCSYNTERKLLQNQGMDKKKGQNFPGQTHTQGRGTVIHRS